MYSSADDLHRCLLTANGPLITTPLLAVIDGHHGNILAHNNRLNLGNVNVVDCPLKERLSIATEPLTASATARGTKTKE